MKPQAQYVAHWPDMDGEPGKAMFNVVWPGNELDGSSVCVRTILRLGITDLIDKQGKRLLAVPVPVLKPVLLQ